MDNEKVKLDRMLYVKDKVPSRCAYIGIALDVLYFVLIYQINNEYFYTALVGLSVIVNLLFMLFGFLCSEEVKNYHSKYGYLMIFLGIVEIVRIFIYPMTAHSTLASSDGVDLTTMVMSDSKFVWCIIFLVGAAVAMIAGGLISIKNTKTLNAYKEEIGKQLGGYYGKSIITTYG